MITQAEARELHEAADDLIRGVYEKRVAWSALHAAHERKMRAAYACVRDDAGAAESWQALLLCLGPDSPLLAIEPVIPYLGPKAGNTCLDAVLQLALRHDDWLRPLDEWQPDDDDARGQIGGLARHLLTCYEVPEFMDAAWFEGFGAEGDLHRNWFVHIGTGGNVRAAGGPMHLTKMAAHRFLQAPAEYSIVHAVRWAQTLALGGGDTMARAIAASRLGNFLPDEPFWESVIHFFVNNPAMDTGRIGPIVDYVLHTKFGEKAVGMYERQATFEDAPEPDFSMKGRTLVALTRRMEEWHEQLARDSKRPKKSWEPSGIEGLQVEERDEYGSLNAWAVVELLSTMELMDEGRAQHHCVFSYAPQCLHGTTSIWSLRVRSAGEGKRRRLLTIEVDNTRRAIVQVRGNCNKTLSSYRGRGRMKVAGEMLRRWARQARLSIACAL